MASLSGAAELIEKKETHYEALHAHSNRSISLASEESSTSFSFMVNSMYGYIRNQYIRKTENRSGRIYNTNLDTVWTKP